jgi:CDP-glycerol glycerophosphotransferase (TagB/SpsB family)
MTVRFIEGERRLEIIKRMYPDANFILTGFAKLDPLYNNEVEKLNLDAMGLDPGKQTILYAPTFYPSSIELFKDTFPSDFLRYNIIVKPHYFSMTKAKYIYQRNKFNAWGKQYSNVYIASLDEHSLLPFMATADLLISEASSSLFEFAALDKPVVWCDFFHLRWSYKGPFRFRLTRRLDQDILKFSDIGAHAPDYASLKKIVDEQLANPQMFSSKRKKYCDLFVGARDGKASRRIADYLCGS